MNTFKNFKKVTMKFANGEWKLRYEKNGEMHECIGKRPIDVLEQAANAA